MADWRTATLNSSLSSSQRQSSASQAASPQSNTGRFAPISRPQLSEEHSREKEPAISLEESRLETQQAILEDTLAQLKSEEQRIEEDAWMAAIDVNYSDEFLDTFGLLKACMQAGEKSARVLKLTEKCIELAGSHYTAWDYRFQCLLEGAGDIEDEWGLCWAIGERSCKNYQLWNHRRRCALVLGAANADRELEFAAHFLAEDAKNYHIWAHRQVIVRAYDKWHTEWAFVERCLAEDLRNNSAWTQRAFLLQHRVAEYVRPGGSAKSDAAALKDALLATDEGADGAVTRCVRAEVTRVAEAARVMPHNQSAWNYLVGLPSVVADALAEVARHDVGAPCGSEASAEAAQHSGAGVSPDSGGAPAAEHAAVCGRDASGAPGNDTGSAARKVEAGYVAEQAAAALAAQPPAVRTDVTAALAVIARAGFDIPLDVLKSSLSCVPARVALLRAYAAAAQDLGTPAADRAAAREAAGVLARGLQTLDPLRRGWYAFVGGLQAGDKVG